MIGGQVTTFVIFVQFWSSSDLIGQYCRLSQTTSFNDKKSQIKNIRLDYHLCGKPTSYHSATKSQVLDRLFKLIRIYTSVIYQIHWKFLSIGNELSCG